MIQIARSLEVEKVPCFKPGDLVRHVRYGYRGVIVESDGACRADPQWYLSNQTRPQRNQPWHHVLVHGTVSTTYAAQSSLRPDPERQPVDHPLVEEFFETFDSGRYRRNDRSWPGW